MVIAANIVREGTTRRQRGTCRGPCADRT